MTGPSDHPDPALAGPDALARQEALYMARALAEMVGRHLGAHPALASHPAWTARAEQAADILASLSRDIAAAQAAPDRAPEPEAPGLRTITPEDEVRGGRQVAEE